MNTIVPKIAYSYQIKGVTTLFLTNFKNKVTTPKSIAWEDVNLSSKWELEEAQSKNPQLQDDVESITEHPDGKVTINFANTPRSYFSSTIKSIPSEAGSYRSTTSSFHKSIPKSPSIHPSGIAFPVYSKTNNEDIQSVRL
eukprot:TRINITY_DN26958_c0_g3_i3.p1 TRINITY_DN26958_c0_g3~~TRINITY_DN26958_c0_g3_i3.p1  ORF type:complete len:140 (+),score=14.18 TRINITY_DN26958_c0_g3_i3:565-984(+)